MIFCDLHCGGVEYPLFTETRFASETIATPLAFLIIFSPSVEHNGASCCALVLGLGDSCSPGGHPPPRLKDCPCLVPHQVGDFDLQHRCIFLAEHRRSILKSESVSAGALILFGFEIRDCGRVNEFGGDMGNLKGLPVIIMRAHENGRRQIGCSVLTHVGVKFNLRDGTRLTFSWDNRRL